MTHTDPFPKGMEHPEVEPTPSSVVIDLSRGGEYSIDPTQATPLEVRGGDGLAAPKMSRYATVELAPHSKTDISPEDPDSATVDVWVAEYNGQSRTFVAPRAVDLSDPRSGNQIWHLQEGAAVELGRKTAQEWEQRTGEQLPATVSGKHLAIRHENGQIIIADRHSSNGTLIEVGMASTAELPEVNETVASKRVVNSLGTIAGNLYEQVPGKDREGLSDAGLREFIELSDSLRTGNVHGSHQLEAVIQDRVERLESADMPADAKTLQRLVLLGAAQGLESRQSYNETILAAVTDSEMLPEIIKDQIARVASHFDKYPARQPGGSELGIGAARGALQDERRREVIIDNATTTINQARRQFEDSPNTPEARQALACLSALEAGILSLRAHGKALNAVYDMQHALRGELDVASKLAGTSFGK